MSEIVINGIKFGLKENPLYRKSRDCFESKYRVVYFSDLYGCWCFLYSCDNKRDFNRKRIEEYYRLY